MRFDQYSDRLLWSCIGILSLTALVAQLALLERRPPIRVELEPHLFTAELAGEGLLDVGPGAYEFEAQPSREVQQEATGPQPSITDLLIEAIIQIESGGKPDVVGNAGERGLMQIKKETWREVTANLYGKPVSFARAFEPELNREVGQAYLRMLCTFLYENQSEWKSDMRSLLLASYNAGPTHVREIGFNLRLLPASTQDYVDRALALHDFFLSNAPEVVGWSANDDSAGHL